MAKTLVILNDPPYGTERSYNGLRLAIALLKTQSEEVRIFLMGDAAACAKQGQKVAQGLLQHRRHAADGDAARRVDWRVRHLHGRPGHPRLGARGRHAPEQHGGVGRVA
jgi:sulfur relay (sulfurtransferase) complex TusBCD TusD component (DsrE family)